MWLKLNNTHHCLIRHIWAMRIMMFWWKIKKRRRTSELFLIQFPPSNLLRRLMSSNVKQYWFCDSVDEVCCCTLTHSWSLSETLSHWHPSSFGDLKNVVIGRAQEENFHRCWISESKRRMRNLQFNIYTFCALNRALISLSRSLFFPYDDITFLCFSNCFSLSTGSFACWAKE